jgi:F0F1-type ATP synthase gamma subunit
MTSKERTSLTQNAEAHIKALTAVIDRLREMRATEELRSIARQLSQLSLKASPSPPLAP